MLACVCVWATTSAIVRHTPRHNVSTEIIKLSYLIIILNENDPLPKTHRSEMNHLQLLQSLSVCFNVSCLGHFNVGLFVWAKQSLSVCFNVGCLSQAIPISVFQCRLSEPSNPHQSASMWVVWVKQSLSVCFNAGCLKSKQFKQPHQRNSKVTLNLKAASLSRNSTVKTPVKIILR